MRNAAGNGAPLRYGKRLEPLTRWLICPQPQHLIDLIWWSDLGLDKKHPLSRFSCVESARDFTYCEICQGRIRKASYLSQLADEADGGLDINSDLFGKFDRFCLSAGHRVCLDPAQR